MPVKLGTHLKQFGAGSIDGLDMFSVMTTYYKTLKEKILGEATRGRKRIELLHDMIEGRDYGQSKDLISHRSRWRQNSK